MNFQEILVYLIVGIAAGYLLYKFWPVKKQKKNCGKDNCGCS